MAVLLSITARWAAARNKDMKATGLPWFVQVSQKRTNVPGLKARGRGRGRGGYNPYGRGRYGGYGY